MKKLKNSKKGMELNSLYSFVLMLIMVGILIGIGVTVLTRFADTRYSGAVINETVMLNLNTTAANLGTIGTTWLPLIITIAILAIILTLVIRSFGGTGGGR